MQNAFLILFMKIITNQFSNMKIALWIYKLKSYENREIESTLNKTRKANKTYFMLREGTEGILDKMSNTMAWFRIYLHYQFHQLPHTRTHEH